MDDNKLFAIITNFRSTYDLGFQFGKYNEYNYEIFYQIINDMINSGLVKGLLEEDIKIIKRYVDSEFQIYQKDGIALLDDYEHEHNWYTKDKDNLGNFYWNRYRRYLFESGWSTDILNKLDTNTLDSLMNYLGNPNTNEKFSRKGLVMGDVQSGKTSNYIGLITKAVDAGYKVVILLTGVHESLRRQTQIRVEEGFIGYDVENRKWVGVGLKKSEFNIIPKSVTSRVNDFTGIAGENTFLHFKNENTPFIFITKKNSKILKKIRDTITNINIVPPAKKIDTSLLIIDDEADNASVNTSSPEYDPTKINAEIRKLLNLFTKSNYVGFTATPFANVFIDPDSYTEMLEGDLFPKDFIYSLSAPSNYYGAEKIFLNKNQNTVQVIQDSTGEFPLKHDKNWNGHIIFDSLIEAINAFLIINAIRDIREGFHKNSHRSMLVNVSRFINVQERIEFLVTNKLENIVNAIKQSQKLKFKEYIKNEYIKSIYNTYQKHYSNIYNWDEIFECMYEAIKDILIFKIPSKDKKKQLNYEMYEAKGLRAIVIGGLALSRGLTLEGLTISYLYRNTSTFDVLMQMGRWFGYRNKPAEYGDLCKVYMLYQTKKYFEEITTSILDLKNDLKNLVLSKKTPKEFGIRVRNESDKLGITNRNKMRTSKKYVYTSDLFGEVLETPFINSNTEVIKNNLLILEELMSRNEFEKIEGNFFSNQLSANQVLEFLNKLDIHEANRVNYFQKEEIINFIRDYNFEKFDVVIIGGKGDAIKLFNEEIKPSQRSFDLLDDETIRVGGTHRRLGGPSDTKFGLDIDIIKSLEQDGKISSSIYMIEKRNPILIIYPLFLKIIIEDEKGKLTKEEIVRINNLAENYSKRKLTPIGLGIGFPADKKRANTQKKIFYINDRTKWWTLMNGKDTEEDE